METLDAEEEMRAQRNGNGSAQNASGGDESENGWWTKSGTFEGGEVAAEQKSVLPVVRREEEEEESCGGRKEHATTVVENPSAQLICDGCDDDHKDNEAAVTISTTANQVLFSGMENEEKQRKTELGCGAALCKISHTNDTNDVSESVETQEEMNSNIIINASEISSCSASSSDSLKQEEYPLYPFVDDDIRFSAVVATRSEFNSNSKSNSNSNCTIREGANRFADAAPAGVPDDDDNDSSDFEKQETQQQANCIVSPSSSTQEMNPLEYDNVFSVPIAARDLKQSSQQGLKGYGENNRSHSKQQRQPFDEKEFLSRFQKMKSSEKRSSAFQPFAKRTAHISPPSSSFSSSSFLDTTTTTTTSNDDTIVLDLIEEPQQIILIDDDDDDNNDNDANEDDGAPQDVSSNHESPREKTATDHLVTSSVLRKRSGYWNDVATVEKEVRQCIINAGDKIAPGKMPTAHQLKQYGVAGLLKAITRHGGLKFFGERMGLVPSTFSAVTFWRDFANVESAVHGLIQTLGHKMPPGTIPTIRAIEQQGLPGLCFGINIHGGIARVANRMGLEVSNICENNDDEGNNNKNDEDNNSNNNNNAFDTQSAVVGDVSNAPAESSLPLMSAAASSVLSNNLTTAPPSLLVKKETVASSLDDDNGNHNAMSSSNENLLQRRQTSSKLQDYHFVADTPVTVAKVKSSSSSSSRKKTKKRAFGDDSGDDEILKQQSFIPPGVETFCRTREYWEDFTNVEREIRQFIVRIGDGIEPGTMPLAKDLRSLPGYGGLINAMSRHGGFEEVAKRLGLVLPKPSPSVVNRPDYWKKIGNVERELRDAIKEMGDKIEPGRMPKSKELRDNGYSRLAAAISQLGGYTRFAERMGLRVGKTNELKDAAEAVLMLSGICGKKRKEKTNNAVVNDAPPPPPPPPPPFDSYNNFLFSYFSSIWQQQATAHMLNIPQFAVPPPVSVVADNSNNNNNSSCSNNIIVVPSVDTIAQTSSKKPRCDEDVQMDVVGATTATTTPTKTSAADPSSNDDHSNADIINTTNSSSANLPLSPLSPSSLASLCSFSIDELEAASFYEEQDDDDDDGDPFIASPPYSNIMMSGIASPEF